MPRWLWFLPLGLLVLFGAIQAFRLGWIAANLSESEVIEAYVIRYAEEVGIAPQDAPCIATPGDLHWIIVRCGEPGDIWEYRVNRWGGLDSLVRPGDPQQDGRPKT